MNSNRSRQRRFISFDGVMFEAIQVYRGDTDVIIIDDFNMETDWMEISFFTNIWFTKRAKIEWGVARLELSNEETLGLKNWEAKYWIAICNGEKEKTVWTGQLFVTDRM